MAKEAIHTNGPNPWRVVGWSLAALLLLLPLVAMRFTDAVKWDAHDFLFAGIVFGTVGGLFELTVRLSRNIAHRAAVGAALAAAFFILWASGAVGMIGDEDNRYNLLFIGVIGIALAGTVVARFRASGMALAMAAAGVSQIVIAAVGMAADPRGGVFSMLLACPWLLSAWLFRKASADPAAAR
jgi:hypothetical protein